MNKAIRIHDGWSRIPCFAHTLQLVITDSLYSPKNAHSKDFEILIKKCKKIVTHFAKSCNAQKALTE